MLTRLCPLRCLELRLHYMRLRPEAYLAAYRRERPGFGPADLRREVLALERRLMRCRGPPPPPSSDGGPPPD
jgi:hypothetical protein